MQLQGNANLRQRPQSGEEDESMPRLWDNAVTGYTSCDLTKQKDKLVAIWSVAKLVRDALGYAYADGMWSQSLEEQLAWRVIGYKQIEEEIPKEIPSWSWASVPGIIKPQDIKPRHRGSGISDRKYCVKNHNGNRISFNLKQNASVPARPDVDSTDVRPELENKRIAVQAYLQRSFLSCDLDSGKWWLFPVKGDVSETTNTDMEPTRHGVVDHDSIYLDQVFLDTPNTDVDRQHPVWTMILVYSENDGKYWGTGLILDRDQVHSDVYSRRGCFHFERIDLQTLGAFINVSAICTSKHASECGLGNDITSGRAPDNFYLE